MHNLNWTVIPFTDNKEAGASFVWSGLPTAQRKSQCRSLRDSLLAQIYLPVVLIETVRVSSSGDICLHLEGIEGLGERYLIHLLTPCPWFTLVVLPTFLCRCGSPHRYLCSYRSHHALHLTTSFYLPLMQTQPITSLLYASHRSIVSMVRPGTARTCVPQAACTPQQHAQR
ncbi:hypothetical protein BGX38DRAFT_1151116 [Terfezia claveryi]|nr:hypothetical protein BGX38DRAFT_1151116 [Terfezia claveryi]